MDGLVLSTSLHPCKDILTAALCACGGELLFVVVRWKLQWLLSDVAMHAILRWFGGMHGHGALSLLRLGIRSNASVVPTLHLRFFN